MLLAEPRGVACGFAPGYELVGLAARCLTGLSRLTRLSRRTMGGGGTYLWAWAISCDSVRVMNSLIVVPMLCAACAT